jgi:hypothetical protein
LEGTKGVLNEGVSSTEAEGAGKGFLEIFGGCLHENMVSLLHKRGVRTPPKKMQEKGQSAFEHVAESLASMEKLNILCCLMIRLHP